MAGMAATTEAILAQIDELLSRAGLQPGESPRLVEGRVGKGTFEMTALTTAWFDAIERLTMPGDKHREVAARAMEKGGGTATTNYLQLLGALNALRQDYQQGYMHTVAELIHADVFADFMEMAQELLDKHYKDPAAVVAGSVLEEHLRKLCDRHNLAVVDGSGRPLKADFLNAELTKAGAYNKLEQKQVTPWLGLRNDAAHGHYDEYDEAQVALMIAGITDFMVRHPA
jgi:hypothetical protein